MRMMANRQCTDVLERVCKDENVEMRTDDGGWRTEKVSKRLTSWEKMLGRLAKYTSADVFFKEEEGPDAALEVCSFHLGRSPTALDYH